MDKDAKLIFETYDTTVSKLISVCAACEKEHPELAKYHLPSQRTHGLCKRHLLYVYETEILPQAEATGNVQNIRKVRQKIREVYATPDEQLPADLEVVST